MTDFNEKSDISLKVRLKCNRLLETKKFIAQETHDSPSGNKGRAMSRPLNTVGREHGEKRMVFDLPERGTFGPLNLFCTAMTRHVWRFS